MPAHSGTKGLTPGRAADRPHLLPGGWYFQTKSLATLSKWPAWRLGYLSSSNIQWGPLPSQGRSLPQLPAGQRRGPPPPLSGRKPPLLRILLCNKTLFLGASSAKDPVSKQRLSCSLPAGCEIRTQKPFPVQPGKRLLPYGRGFIIICPPFTSRRDRGGWVKELGGAQSDVWPRGSRGPRSLPRAKVR